MAHYRMQDRLPSAIVTAGGSEKKVYEGNTVYLNNGDNFELRFFNPLQEKLGIEIIFNGQNKGDGLLVLNPGEDIKLDRFLDDKKKMLFDTYHIDSNNHAAVEAAAKNGIIDINFYKERNNQFYGNTFITNSLGASPSGTGGLPHYGTTTSKNLNSRDYSSPGTFTQETDFTTTSGDVTLDSLSFSSENERGIEISADLTETGRVEKGETSNQNIKEVDIKFESNPFHSIQYHLTPTSTRTYTTATEIRNYCYSCGYRVRKTTWKFCPKCGEKIM